MDKREYGSFYKEAGNIQAPEKLRYEPEEAESLLKRIAGYLRPALEKALGKQRVQAEAYNGALDVDANSRGMGKSSFVSQLKAENHARLIEQQGELEGAYAAQLLKALQEALGKQEDRALEAERFNAQAENEFALKQADRALALYESYQRYREKQLALEVEQAQKERAWAYRRQGTENGKKQEASGAVLPVPAVPDLSALVTAYEKKLGKQEKELS